MYPFPSFGGWLFYRDEQPIFGTDAGWILIPAYQRSRPVGSTSDVITTISIGSAERTFEVYLTAARFAAFQNLLNTKAEFTDWDRPIPDSRQAFLSEVVPLDNAISIQPDGIAKRKRRVRVTLVSAA